MIFWTLCAFAIGMALVQDVVPGRAVYHYGWYNALAVALVVIAAGVVRGLNSGARMALAGCTLIVLAGVASGLLGPDTQTIAGAPGASVQTKEYGVVSFPLSSAQVPARAYSLDAIFTAVPRDVVAVRASDNAGNRLTITQPANATFLSPVLLLPAHASIAGMDVRTDEFAIPARSLAVRAVLFSAAQATQLPSMRGSDKAAVLFEVTRANGAPLRKGLGIVPSGSAKIIGGVVLGASVENYPFIEAAAAPFAPLLLGGVLLFAAGAVRSRFRSKT